MVVHPNAMFSRHMSCHDDDDNDGGGDDDGNTTHGLQSVYNVALPERVNVIKTRMSNKCAMHLWSVLDLCPLHDKKTNDDFAFSYNVPWVIWSDTLPILLCPKWRLEKLKKMLSLSVLFLCSIVFCGVVFFWWGASQVLEIEFIADKIRTLSPLAYECESQPNKIASLSWERILGETFWWSYSSSCNPKAIPFL